MAKTYKCTNYGICTEADKGTVFQETDLEEVDGKFVCPKCGQALEEIEKKPGANWKIIISILLAIAVAIATFFIIKQSSGNQQEQERRKQEIADSLRRDSLRRDSLRIDSLKRIGRESLKADSLRRAWIRDSLRRDSLEKLKLKPQTLYNLGWGIYEGPMKGGKPDGLGGEVKITKSYKIDMKNGSYKQVTKGDRLVNTKFKEGKLVQGYIHHPGGTQESFTIGY